jgi:alginate O-acetyltransferase complex protein AlgI
MLFTTLAYALFFIVAWGIHWMLPRPLRRLWLLIASYYFYMQAFQQYGILIALLTVGNYGWSWLLWWNQGRKRKVLLATGIILNLGTLAYFKYAGFLVDSLRPLSGIIPALRDPLALHIILPLGISFFTFEFIHYQVEVFRGQEPLKNPINFALFAAFFPTQIAGPIKRFPDWKKQLSQRVRFTELRVDEALKLIMRGMAKKIIVADVLSPLVARGYADPGHLGVFASWIIIYAFAAQIYADFSGYTDIGRGCAILLGYTVPENFNSPYQSCNPSDFWRRWHMSLSNWLRDYLFIPLGGSRVPTWRIYLNNMITMALGGLWHGASWHFMAWGIYQGALLVGFRIWQKNLKTRSPTWYQSWLASRHGVLASQIITFHLVCLGWVIFRAESVKGAARLVAHALGISHQSLTSGTEIFAGQDLALAMVVLPVVATIVVAGWIRRWLDAGPQIMPGWLISLQLQMSAWQVWLQPAIYIATLLLIAIWPAQTAQRFIYFQF